MTVTEALATGTINEALVLDLEDRARMFGPTWNSLEADKAVAETLRQAAVPFTVNGINGMPADLRERHEAKAREDWDQNAFAAGVALESDLERVQAIVRDRIAAAKVLSPTVEAVVSRQERQLEEIAEVLIGRELAAQFATLTPAEALKMYKAADENTQRGRRLVAWLEGDGPDGPRWFTVIRREDGAREANTLADLQWQRSREERQRARVPANLLVWDQKLEGAQTLITFAETMRHLRSGRGIAKRPYLRVLA
jgi:hypothetical protein